jgi:HK97 family phage portal protein
VASFIRTLFNQAPVPFAPTRTAGRAFGALASGSSRTAQMAAMGSVGTLFAIVNRTSNATAQVEWKLYRKAKNGNKDERVEVTSHAALDLWNKPNPWMPRQEFIESTQQHIDLTGEGWWVLYRSPRSPIPLEMWPVRPDRMEPVPSPTGFVAGYTYTSPDGEKIPLGVDEVIFLRMPNPLDPYRGMGPVQSILTDLDATRYSAEWNRNFFVNSAEPGGIIAVDRRLSDDEFNELRMRWNEQHRGVAAAHRVAILEQGQWVDRKMTQRDMQFAELRHVSRDVIREAFGIPGFAIGELTDVNRATAEAAAMWFATYLTVPRLERIKAALNHDLLPMYGATGEGLEFDYCSPIPDDEEAENAELTAKSAAAAVLVEAGWQPDAVLNTVGLPAMPYTGPIGPAPRITNPTSQPQNRHRAHRQPGLRLRDSADSDLEDVRADHEQALASLTTTWDAIEAQWITSLEDQIADAIDSGDTSTLAALTVPTDDAANTLQRALASMASQAATRLVQEAALQGVHITAPSLDQSLTNRLQTGQIRASYGGDLPGVATVTASLLGSGMAASAAREALRVMRPGATGRSVATTVGNALRAAKNWFRRDQLGGALHHAQNVGRLAAIEAGPPGAVITATEVHDDNRCGPCGAIDGTQFASLHDAEAAYGTGGYINCDGGIRCRGTVVATWP